MSADVVFLEDNEELRQIMTVLLESELRVRCLSFARFADLEKNVSAVLKTKIAILDINLGVNEPSGIDAYNWLRLMNYQGQVVFMTGHAQSHPLVLEATKTGAVVLEKPMKAQILFDIVRSAC